MKKNISRSQCRSKRMTMKRVARMYYPDIIIADARENERLESDAKGGARVVAKSLLPLLSHAQNGHPWLMRACVRAFGVVKPGERPNAQALWTVNTPYGVHMCVVCGVRQGSCQ